MKGGDGWCLKTPRLDFFFDPPFPPRKLFSIKPLELTAPPVRLADPHAPGAAAAAAAIAAAFLAEDVGFIRDAVVAAHAAVGPDVVELPAWHRGPGLDGLVFDVDMCTDGIVDARAPVVTPRTSRVHVDRLPSIVGLVNDARLYRHMQTAKFTIFLVDARKRDYPPEVRPPAPMPARNAFVPRSRWPGDATLVPIVDAALAALRDAPHSPFGATPLALNLVSTSALSRRGAGTRVPVEVMGAGGLPAPALGSSVDARAIVVVLNSNGVDPPTAASLIDEPIDVSFDREGADGRHVAVANWGPKVTVRGTHEVADLLGTEYPSPYLAHHYAMSVVPTATLRPELRDFGPVPYAHFLLVLEPLAPQAAHPYVAASFAGHDAPLLNGARRGFRGVALRPPDAARVPWRRDRRYDVSNSQTVSYVGGDRKFLVFVRPEMFVLQNGDPATRYVPQPSICTPVRLRGILVPRPGVALMSTLIDVSTVYFNSPSFILHLTPLARALERVLGAQFDRNSLRASFAVARGYPGVPPDAAIIPGVDFFVFLAANQAAFGLPPARAPAALAGAPAGALPAAGDVALALANPAWVRLARTHFFWWRESNATAWTQNNNFLTVLRDVLPDDPVHGDVLPVAVAVFAGPGLPEVTNAGISFYVPPDVRYAPHWRGVVNPLPPGVADSVNHVLADFANGLPADVRRLGVSEYYGVARDGVTPVIAFHAAARRHRDTRFWQGRGRGFVVPPDGWLDA